MKTLDDDLLAYDDEEAVKFILEQIPDEYKSRITEDKIDYVLDVVYEFYDEKGFIEEDSAEEATIDEEEMSLYIAQCAKKDKVDLKEEEIALILDCEYEYGKSKGIYDEE